MGDDLEHHRDRAFTDPERTRALAGLETTQRVFVDISGRRRRLVAWFAVALCGIGLGFLGVLWFSQAGAPARAPDVVVCVSPSTRTVGSAGPGAGRASPRSAERPAPSRADGCLT